MGNTVSNNTNQEGKIYNVNDDTSLIESPFISTETYNEIKNTNAIDTPLSDSVQSNLSVNANSENFNVNSFSQNSFEVNSFDKAEGQIDGSELFVKPANTSNIDYEISFGSFNTPFSEYSEGIIEPVANNSEGVILSINGFSNSFSLDSYKQVGGNLIENSINSEGSFDLNEYRPMDVQDLTKVPHEDDIFSIDSHDFIRDVLEDKKSRGSRKSRKSKGSRGSRKSRSSSRRKSSRRKSSRRRRSRKQKGGNSSESELNYNFSATSSELLSSPQVGGGDSDSVSVNSQSSDVDQFRITGMRVLN